MPTQSDSKNLFKLDDSSPDKVQSLEEIQADLFAKINTKETPSQTIQRRVLEKRQEEQKLQQIVNATMQPKSPIQIALEIRPDLPINLAAGLELQINYDNLPSDDRQILRDLTTSKKTL